jgi:hypothetical protein
MYLYTKLIAACGEGLGSVAGRMPDSSVEKCGGFDGLGPNQIFDIAPLSAIGMLPDG